MKRKELLFQGFDFMQGYQLSGINEPLNLGVQRTGVPETLRCLGETLVDKFFGGSKKALFSALLSDEELTDAELEELRAMIEKR